MSYNAALFRLAPPAVKPTMFWGADAAQARCPKMLYLRPIDMGDLTFLGDYCCGFLSCGLAARSKIVSVPEESGPRRLSRSPGLLPSAWPLLRVPASPAGR